MPGTKAPGAMTREMMMVHTGLMREFGHLPRLVSGVFDGAVGHAEIVADHIALMSLIVHEHHESEDLGLWPKLLEHCPEETAPLVHAMERYHERIAELLGDLTMQASAWRGDANAAARDAMVGILETLLPVLREHLAEEVEYVLPLVEKHVTGDEWDAMVAGGVVKIPQEKLPLILGIVMYEGEPSAIEDALAKMPAEARPMIAETAPQLYGDYAELVYGTRTPPYGHTLADHV